MSSTLKREIRSLIQICLKALNGSYASIKFTLIFRRKQDADCRRTVVSLLGGNCPSLLVLKRVGLAERLLDIIQLGGSCAGIADLLGASLNRPKNAVLPVISDLIANCRASLLKTATSSSTDEVA